MRIFCYPRDRHDQQHDNFVVEGPWAEVERILLWTKANSSPYYETYFTPSGDTPPLEVRYCIKFKDERDAIFFKMMWYGFAEAA